MYVEVALLVVPMPVTPNSLPILFAVLSCYLRLSLLAWLNRSLCSYVHSMPTSQSSKWEKGVSPQK